MRWLTSTVAGSICRGGLLQIALLLVAFWGVNGQTVETSASDGSASTERQHSSSGVTIVTSSHLTKEPGPRRSSRSSQQPQVKVVRESGENSKQPDAQVTVITGAEPDAERSEAQVVVVTEINRGDKRAPAQEREANSFPYKHANMSLGQVTIINERTATEASPAVTEKIQRSDFKKTVAQVSVVTQRNQSGEGEPPLPPSEFNPDPGASMREAEPETAPPELFPPILPQTPEYGEEALPRSLELPRKGVREVVAKRKKLEYENYPDSEAGEGLLPSSEPVPNRWFIGFGRWKRYADPSTETTYQSGLKLWHPYLQSELKGDAPIFNTQDIFANITVENFFQTEFRKLPTPSGVSAERPNSSEFFGRGDQFFWSNDFSIGLDLFRGETAFKPVEWALRLLAVYNHNYIDVEERNVVNPNAQNGTTRDKNFVSLQEAFVELHIRDLSNNYDFISSRTGIQPFVSDFRGFIFNDTNLGVRIFGNYDNNRWQYNVAVFDMLEKDTYSDLNEFSRRDQQVYVANVFRQDLFWKGYTGELSFVGDFDNNSRHYDKNGFITRPAPIGTVGDHYVQAYYLGWTGDGHIGWLNIDHAFYQVLGEDSLNGIAGRRVDINAQMAAVELSVDKNWLRHKLSFFYASGDSDPTDSHATGFDTAMDRPFFIGGPFSYYSHQGFNLGGTSVNFKQRDSLVIDFRTSKTEGQANFVNPGAIIIGYGLDADVTPKLKAFVNANYIRTATTAPTELVLFTNHSSNDFALDFSAGFEWRPLLTENVIVTAGAGFLVPRWGYKDIYRTNTVPVHGFPQPAPGQVDDFLYSAIVTLTLTY